MKVLFLHENSTFPPLDKRNTCDKAKGLLGHFEGDIGELGARCLCTLKIAGRTRGNSLNMGCEGGPYSGGMQSSLRRSDSR